MTAPNRKQVTRTITAGPNEMQMMMSLMRHDSDIFGGTVSASEFTAVHFTVVPKEDGGERTELFATIDRMERKGGSGHQWNISGYVVKSDDFRKIEGSYCSKTRKGTLSIQTYEWE